MQVLELKIPPPVWTLLHALALYGVASHWPVPGVMDSLWYHSRVHLLWLAPWLLIGLGLDLSGVWRFVREKTTVNPLTPRKTAVLVTGGVYRFSRNPMYVGMVCLLTAWALWLLHPVGLLAVPSLVGVLTRWQIVPEERFLSQRFGAQYVAYCQQVRRWL